MQILRMTDTAISEEHLYLFFPLAILEIYQFFFSSSKTSESECSEEGH